MPYSVLRFYKLTKAVRQVKIFLKEIFKNKERNIMLKKFVMFLFVAGLLIAAPEAGAQSSIDDLRAAAEKGDVEAQLELGFIYEEGRGVRQDHAAAVKWYRKAAEQGLAKAQFKLGLRYSIGLGVLEDTEEALKWQRKAAEQGDPDGQAALSVMYGKGHGVPQDDREMIKWLQKAAVQGHAMAQSSLGTMYINGRGVQQNYTEAVKWVRKAAEQGYIEAQYNLGLMYDEGLGVPKDSEKAIKWYRKAAEQGYEGAQVNLSFVYLQGRGVEQNLEEGYFWLGIRNDPRLAELRQALSQELTPQQRERVEARLRDARQQQEKVEMQFRESWHKAITGKDAEEQYGLGLLYLRGVEIPADFSAARQWIQAAASQGHEKAQELLRDGLLETIWAEESNKRQEETALEKEMLLWVDAVVMDVMRFDSHDFLERLKGNTLYFTQDGWESFGSMIREMRMVEMLQNDRLSVSMMPWHSPEIVHRENLQDGRMLFIVDAVYGIRLSAENRKDRVRSLRLRISVKTDAARRGIEKDFTISRWAPGPDRPFVDVP